MQLGARVDEPLAQALTLASMHQSLPSEYLIADFVPGPAEPFREQARKLLPEKPTERQVELTALSLFEQSAAQAPRTITLIPSPEGGVRPGQGMAESGLYTAKLAAALGGPAFVLAPALMTVLGDFKADQLWTDTKFPGSNSQYRAVGEFRDVQLAHLVASPLRETPQGHRMRGILDPIESANIEIALADMERKIPGSTDSFGTVHVRTVLGESQDPRTGLPTGGVHGLAGEEEIGLSREVARDLESCKQTTYHEAGHELDRQRGNLSLREDSPFGKTSNPEDYVSPYAQTYPWEDLAETNRVLFDKFEAIQANPDLWLHARGEVGAKLAFLLKEGYGMSVPPPSARFTAALESVRAGEGPFGWSTADGSKVLCEADFRGAVRNLTNMWDGLGDPPASMALVANDPKLRWVAEKLLGAQLPEAPPMGSPMMMGGLGGLAGGGFGQPLELGQQSLPVLQEGLRALADAPARLAEILPRAQAALAELPEGRERAQVQSTILMIENELERTRLAPIYRGEVETGAEARALLEGCGAGSLAPADGALSQDQKKELISRLYARSQERMSQGAELMREHAMYGSNLADMTPPPISREYGTLQAELGQHQMRLFQQLSVGGPALMELLDEPATRDVLKQFRPNPLLVV